MLENKKENENLEEVVEEVEELEDENLKEVNGGKMSDMVGIKVNVL